MKKRILIIEDEPEIAMIMRMRLEANGYDAIEAHDGQEGLLQAKSCSPDLILLDLILPKMAGTQILEALKKDDRYKNIPVIIITGLAQEATNHQATIAKADAFFLKPYDSVELMAAISDLLKPSHN